MPTVTASRRVTPPRRHPRSRPAHPDGVQLINTIGKEEENNTAMHTPDQNQSEPQGWCHGGIACPRRAESRARRGRYVHVRHWKNALKLASRGPPTSILQGDNTKKKKKRRRWGSGRYIMQRLSGRTWRCATALLTQPCWTACRYSPSSFFRSPASVTAATRSGPLMSISGSIGRSPWTNWS